MVDIKKELLFSLYSRLNKNVEANINPFVLNSKIIQAVKELKTQAVKELKTLSEMSEATQNLPTTALSAGMKAAAMDGKPGEIARLLAAGQDADAVDVVGSTALMKAAMNGHTECVSLLLDGGATVDLQDSDNGMSALHWAAITGRLGACQVLVDAGASTSLKTTRGRTVMDLAVHANMTDVVTYLESVKREQQRLHYSEYLAYEKEVDNLNERLKSDVLSVEDKTTLTKRRAEIVQLKDVLLKKNKERIEEANRIAPLGYTYSADGIRRVATRTPRGWGKQGEGQ